MFYAHLRAKHSRWLSREPRLAPPRAGGDDRARPWSAPVADPQRVPLSIIVPLYNEVR